MPGPAVLEVTPAEQGMKLSRFIERRLGKSVPGSAVMRWIRTGRVRVNKKRSKPFNKLAAGDLVRVPPFEPGPPAPPSPAVAGPLDIVAQYEDLLVLAKPAGLAVHPGTGHSDCLSARLAARYAGQPFIPTLAHRLDKDTSGLVLAAASHPRLIELHGLFKTGRIHKTYLAWVRGKWAHNAPLTMKDRLAKQGPRNKEKVAAGHGKQAESLAAPVIASARASLLMVRIFTGRTHQIRVQLSERGHPIVGDRKYGGGAMEEGMLLHAWQVELPDERFRLAPDWPGEWGVAGLERELEECLVGLEDASGGRGARPPDPL